MALKFWCPKCGAQNLVSNSRPGAGVECSRCGKSIVVPKNYIKIDETNSYWRWLWTGKHRPSKAKSGSKAEKIEKKIKRWHIIAAVVVAMPIDYYLKRKFGHSMLIDFISYILGYLIIYSISRIYQETLDSMTQSQRDAPADDEASLKESREAILRQINARTEKKKSISRRFKID